MAEFANSVQLDSELVMSIETSSLQASVELLKNYWLHPSATLVSRQGAFKAQS